MAYNIVKHRRGTTNEWLELDLVPEAGELVIEECLDGNRKCKIGDGITAFSSLPYLADDVKTHLLDMLEKAVATFDKKLLDLDSELNKSFLAIISDTNKKIADQKNEISTAIIAVKDTTNAQLELLNNRISDSDESTRDELDTLSNTLLETFRNELAASESLLLQEAYKADSKLEQQIALLENSVISTFGTQIENLRTDLLDKISVSSTELESKVKELKAQIEALDYVSKTSFDSVISEVENNTRKEITAAINDHKTELAEKTAAIENAITSVETRVQSVENSCSDVSEEVLELRNSTETFIADLESSLIKTFKEELQYRDTAISDLDTSIAKKLSGITADYKNSIKVLEDLLSVNDERNIAKITDLSITIERLSKLILDINKSLNSTASDIKRLIEADLAFTSALDVLKSSVEQGFVDIHKKQEAIVIKQYNDHIATLQKLELLGSTQQELHAESLSLLYDYVSAIYNELAECNENDFKLLYLIFAESRKAFKNLEETQDSFDEKLQEAIEALDGKIQENTSAISEVSESLANTEQALTDKIEELDIRLTRTVSENKQEIVDDFHKVRSDLTAKVNATISDAVDDLTATVSTATNTFETAKIDLEEEIAETSRELSENIETLRSNTNLEFFEVQKTLDDIQTEAIAENQFIVAEFSRVKNNLKTAESNLISADTALSERIDELSAADNEIYEELEEQSEKISRQSDRISSLISLKDGSTTGDAELIDARTDYSGLKYSSAGDHIRTIGQELDDLRSSLPDFIPSNAVDGLLYENNLLYLTSKDVIVSEPVEITGGSGGGGGGSITTVRVVNNLPSSSFVVAKENKVEIRFTYTSFEGDIATAGNGSYSITINDKKIDALSGSILHNVEKPLEISEYLKNGSNTVRVTCMDPYGASRSLVYSINVVELRIESTFDNSKVFSDTITFRYKIFGQIEKTINIFVDGDEYFTNTVGANISGRESALTISKQTHGVHKITAYLSSTVGETDIRSNILEFEVICTEPSNNRAAIISNFNKSEVLEGDIITIPYVVHDPVSLTSNIELIISSRLPSGELLEISRNALVVDRNLQYWKTREYPAGTTVFTISYTYNLYGVPTTVTKSHTVLVNELDIDVSAEDQNLQLFLNAQGRSNQELNPAVWEFTQKPEGGKTFETITTSFTNFNWKTNGWLTGQDGDACLRLNGDARATINFQPFATDFKENGKTIEFEFAVRDVNSRDAVVIDCFDGSRGFRATTDTAFLQSSGTVVSCRYKDEERIRVAVSVEHSASASRFVSIYLDGVLSGVRRYASADIFKQERPMSITLGSNLCGLDLYSIRVYNTALPTPQILTNYIADMAEPTVKQKLVVDNEILDENGKISYDRVKELGQIPIITFTGPMPTFKGDKKKKSTRMKFEDPLHEDLNFDVLLDQIDVQGTSSQFYARKNWKVKLPEALPHMPGAIPAKVYCIKVDYAEATGTHNTGTANYVETFYDRDIVTLPPQKVDPRVRTTIQGFPIIIFEKATEDSEPVFSSKGNFNYDKDAENAFGFTEEFDDYGVECWEFCNNTSEAVNFTGNIPEAWEDDFEPRYVPESANFERIEELLELKEAAANNTGNITEAQLAELKLLQTSCIANFKTMHDWVCSTATFDIIPDPNNENKTIRVPISEEETRRRLDKFKNEFTNYFNMHYCSIYYVFTLFALMTDQRAKNMFLTRWKDDDGVHRWYPYFYDNDTIFGINNEGALVFDYYHEDIDQLDASNVYNGQNSVLWNNFRECFAQEIKEAYAELRKGPDSARPGWNAPLSYEKIIEQYVTKGSDKWSASIYNEDAEYKYVSMARQLTTQKDEFGNEITDVDDSNLYQVRGPGEHHLRYFIANRINYCDSKWYAGKYPSDDIFLRIYTPTVGENATEEEIERINKTLAKVPASPNIEITPFSDMYAGVRYKSGTLLQKRAKAGEPVLFSPLDENERFNDTETAIYGASEISSLGDLSGLYCGVINLSKASKLTELKIGNADPDYHNDNFREISVGSNRLLKSIDLRNCSGLGIAGSSPQKTLDLSMCPNIETILTEGTNLELVDIPDGGYIKTLHLPASISTVIIKNQQHIEDFSIAAETYENIKTLCIENTPAISTDDILDKCKKPDGSYYVEHVRLTGINWSFDDTTFIKSLFPVYDNDGLIIGGIRGIDDKNNPLPDAYLVGTCHIKSLSGKDFAEIKQHYPYLTITYDELRTTVTFKSYDGSETLWSKEIVNTNSTASDCEDPVLTKKIAEPTLESTDEFDYKWAGWTRNIGEAVHADALKAIDGDRVLYPAFSAIRRNYTVEFINPTAPEGDRVIYTTTVPYGDAAEYRGETPVRLDMLNTLLYEFSGWLPDPSRITGPTKCKAQFKKTGDTDIWHPLDIMDITNCVDVYGNPTEGYSVNLANNTMSILVVNNQLNDAVLVPDTLFIEDPYNRTFTIIEVGGFRYNRRLEIVELPETVKKLLDSAFFECNNLFEINLPEGLESIEKSAFQNCYKLRAIKLPASLKNIGSKVFADCRELEDITIADGNTIFKMETGCLINTTTDTLLKGIVSSSGKFETKIPESVKILDSYCFASTQIADVEIPDAVTRIPDNAFNNCYLLSDVKLPANLHTLGATCFYGCTSLKNIELPKNLNDILTYVFFGCAFEEITIPASVSSISNRAFGNITGLKTVTFECKLNEDGSVKVPDINSFAFYNAGAGVQQLTFRVPWTEEQHKEHFEGYYSDILSGGLLPKDPNFGAKNCSFEFGYRG